MTTADLRAAEEAVVGIFSQIHESVGARADLRMDRAADRGLTVSLQPYSSSAARIAAHVVNESQVNLFLGEDSVLELLADRHVTEIAPQIRDVAEAVVSGSLVETLWEFAGRVLRSTVEVNLGSEQRIVASHSHGLFLFLFILPMKRRQRNYASY